MSLPQVTAPKHCAKHGLNAEKLSKKLFYIFSSSLFSFISALFLLYLILRPTKPRFYLTQTDIYLLNFSSPHLLTSSMQITLFSKNPNKRVGIYYEDLKAFAAFRGQQISVGASLPPFYQGHEDRNLLSASLSGSLLPVAPSLVYELRKEELAGKVRLSLKLNGQVRWKVGSWVSGRFHLDVECVAVIFVVGQDAILASLGTTEGIQCSTDV